MNHAASLTAQRFRSPLLPGEIFLALLLLAFTPFFFLSGPAWLAAHSLGTFTDLAHVVFFALLTMLIHRRMKLEDARQWLIVTGAVALISIAVELVQSQVGRTPSLHDGLRNLTGVWLVAFWVRRPTMTVWMGRSLVGALVLVDFALVAIKITEQRRMIEQLPLLCGMESAWEVRRWQAVDSGVDQSGEFASEGSFSLRLELTALPYSGTALRQMPNDWSQFGQLSFDLYNPNKESLRITARISDVHHERGKNPWRFDDRFNKRLSVAPGWNTFTISLREVQEAPNDRLMDMKLIKELRLFAAGLEEPKVIYLDNFRLTD